MNGLRDDSIQHMREEITDLAAGYGIDIMFTAMGMADVATLVDALTTLGELIGADKKRSALEREGAQLLLDDMIGHLTRN